jgi:lipid II:glycine glycyltransferase (peptidoglycan interpeptide bridge formation enzyme)
MFREALLQSELWKNFQEKNGRICVKGNFGLAIVETLPIVGKYLYVPRGPLVSTEQTKEELIHVAQEHNAGWIRVEPGSEAELTMLRSGAKEYRSVSAPHTVQPKEILVVNIENAESELLAQMKSKTRYNIRLAEKRGVAVRFSRATEDVEAFISLIYATTRRKEIRPHPKQYYQNFFAVFNETVCTLALAEYQGKVLAANLLVFFEDTAYYLHGGSSDEGKNLMAPFLLQWESIKLAKERGMKQYNFGGVHTLATNHTSRPANSDWAGITRFKQGFAPNASTLSFPGTYDIIISPIQYGLYRIIRFGQKIKNLLSL